MASEEMIAHHTFNKLTGTLRCVGAGFYLDATQDKWKKYRMYSYITKELMAVLEADSKLDTKAMSIFGHSMGGHGALTIGLKKEGMFKAISAFSPICHPCECPWGHKGAPQSRCAARVNDTLLKQSLSHRILHLCPSRACIEWAVSSAPGACATYKVMSAAFGGYLGDDKAQWTQYDATELLKTYSGPKLPVLVDQGLADGFYKARTALKRSLPLRCARRIAARHVVSIRGVAGLSAVVPRC